MIVQRSIQVSLVGLLFLVSLSNIVLGRSIYAGLNNKYQFARPTSAQFAAGVLGTSAEELARVIFNTNASAQTLSPSYRSDKDSSSGGTNEFSAVEALEGFVTGLYAEAFQAIVSLINRYVLPKEN